MHIALGGDIGVKSVDPLHLGKRCQGDNVTDLCLSTCKHSGAVYARNQIHLRGKRTDLIDRTTVRTLAILENHLANRLLLILIERLAEHRKPLLVIRERLLKLLRDRTDILFALLLLIGKYRFLHLLRRNDLTNFVEQFLRNRAAFIAVLRFSDFTADLIDKRNNRLIYIVTLVDRFDHLGLGNLICPRLDHDHLLRRGSNRELKIAFIPLLLRRIDDELSIDHTHLRHRTRSVERNIGNCSRKCRSDHGNDLRTTRRIYRHYHIIQRHIIAIVLRKQRTHRPVDHAGGQDGILGCLSLSLIKSSRDLADGIHLLFKFYR